MEISTAIMIKFLIIYCPTRVSINGAPLNTWSGNRIKGEKVSVIWIRAINTVIFLQIFAIRNTPITVSQMANNRMETSEGIRPKKRL
jgi:hypothetical protein